MNGFHTGMTNWQDVNLQRCRRVQRLELPACVPAEFMKLRSQGKIVESKAIFGLTSPLEEVLGRRLYLRTESPPILDVA